MGNQWGHGVPQTIDALICAHPEDAATLAIARYGQETLQILIDAMAAILRDGADDARACQLDAILRIVENRVWNGMVEADQHALQRPLLH